MMKHLPIFFLLIALLAFSGVISAQNQSDTTKVYRVDATDGNIYTGTIVSETADTLILRTEKLGTLKLARRDIQSTSVINGTKIKDGQLWLSNPQSSRYFWAPNGYGLKAGEGYYQNIWVFYNQLSVGLTDNFSLGFGMMPLFLLDAGVTPVWLVPKFSIPVVENKFNLGAGAFLGTVIGEGSEVFGLLYGTSTFGSRDKNVSVGLAYGFAADDWMNIPVVNISSLIRTGPRGYFITENYFISADGDFVAIFSVGGRTIIRNIGLDYSLWIPAASGMDTFVAAPFLGITVPIGKKN